MVDQLAGPLGYSAIWAWLLGAMTVVPLALFAAPRIREMLSRRANRPKALDLMRSRCLRVIACIGKDHAAGIVTAREAHTLISSTVRNFVSERTGQPVEAMTLAEIEQWGTDPALIELIRSLYVGAFSAAPTGTVADSVGLAREVVTAWS
ncbi:hypothetical protein [Cryobacterium zhongshanensis]|uniref:Uncharacterized protein n=1 Tax=Cryobacterium zhongshanensis TaxID=2928153 RepID=A0AA41UK48_9MICO|nr:hypothetical protein [Cryobacterium zhongshanensis]MCI4657621.1 hypothetical protein [Cryobacterium zhongshanensis]